MGRAAGDVVLEGRLLTRRGTIRIRSGDPDGALRHLRRSARLLRRRAAGWAGLEQLFHAHAYSLASVAQRRRGRYLAARHDLLRALAIVRGIVRGIGDAGLEELGDLARLDLLYGRFDAALRAAVAARRCLSDDAPPTATMDALGNEARVRIATGDLPGARRLAERRLAATASRRRTACWATWRWWRAIWTGPAATSRVPATTTST